MCLLKIQAVSHMFSLVRVFVKITLRGSLKVLLCVLGGLEILMKDFEKRSAEYQKCLVARDDKPGKVKKQFSDIKNLLEKRQENLNYRRPLFLRHSISLHNIRLCCLTLKL